MKYPAFFLSVVGMLVSCKSDRIGLKPVDCIVKYQNSISLKKYSMTFVGLEDGRCPENTNCFVGGSVYVDLKFGSLESTSLSKQARLCLGNCFNFKNSKTGRPDAANVDLDGKKYLFTLVEVNPYPATSEAAQQKEKYEIKIKIQTIP